MNEADKKKTAIGKRRSVCEEIDTDEHAEYEIKQRRKGRRCRKNRIRRKGKGKVLAADRENMEQNIEVGFILTLKLNVR